MKLICTSLLLATLLAICGCGLGDYQKNMDEQRARVKLFDDESRYLDSDAVFGVKASLVRHFEPRGADDPERPDGVDGPWYSLENDFVLVRS